MKHKYYFWGLLLVVFAMTLQSCIDDNEIYDPPVNYPNAIVTIKTNTATGQVYFQLDDSTTILPADVTISRFAGKEVRALVNIMQLSEPSAPYTRSALVYWVDTVLTKKMAPDLALRNDSVYGKDPIEIVKSWTTIAEDGYLTLCFRTYFGNGRTHVINLVKGDNPYEVVLHHNANGDTDGRIRDGHVAFRLNDLPDTHGQTVDLTLKWQSFSGPKSTTFKYKSRQ